MDIAWLDFLSIDQCEAHGVWFDRAELEKALSSQVGANVVGVRPPPRNNSDDNDTTTLLAVLTLIH